jgi:hypothetical protein
MRSQSVQSRRSICARAVAACSALLICALFIRADEPGQTPRPKDAGPPSEVPEEEQVKLDKKFPDFEFVEDDAPFAFRGNKIIDVRIANVGYRELKAYDYVLEFASRQPTERMRKYSIKDVPVENLFRKIRQDYLRELLHFEGKVGSILAMKSTDDLKELSGIENLYEVWLWPRNSSKWVCVVVSELPEGLKPGKDQDKWVAFDAYYFKLWHYESERKKADSDDPEKRQWERAPLFLGKTVEVIADPSPPPPPTYSPVMLGAVIAGLATICVTAFLISLWFRKGDRHGAHARQKIEEQATFDDVPDLGGPANRVPDQSFPQ